MLEYNRSLAAFRPHLSCTQSWWKQGMAADPLIYCLKELTDYDQFERLCHDLMALSGFADIEPLGGSKDKGRDALHVSRNGKSTTIFAYSVREDWEKKLKEDADKVITHSHVCNRFVFLCTERLT